MLQGFPEHTSIVDHFSCIGRERWLQRFSESHRLGGDHMHQWTALASGEDCGIDLFDVTGTADDQATTGPAQSLVGCHGHHLSMRHW